MTVGLIDVDGHNFPNLALMRISSWHKSQGDTVVWWSKERDHYDVVYKSKVFSDAYSKDVPDPENTDRVIRGGTGYAIHLENGIEVFDKTAHDDLPEEMEKCFPDYSIYPQYEFAVAMTSRGCPRQCSFCHVAAKEGCQTVKVADVSDFWNGQKDIKVLDPNITACREKRDLFWQYRETGAWIDFTQGLDIRLLNEADIADINAMKIKQIHFAWDNPKDDLADKFRAFSEAWRIKDYRRKTVYILTNFNSTMEENLYRIYTVRDLGYSPYVMVYDKPRAPKVIKQLQRWCNSPRIFKKVKRFEDYSVGKEIKATVMNSIEIYLCPEDRARIDKLIHRIDVIAGVIELPVTGDKIEGPSKEELKAAITEAVAEPFPADPFPTPEEKPAEAEPPKEEDETPKTVTMDQVQAVVRQLIKPGSPHRDEAKKIVQEYAPKVSAIPEEKLAEVFGRLSELDRGVA